MMVDNCGKKLTNYFIFLERRIRPSEITTINGNVGTGLEKHENPPFLPAFFAVKLRLNDSNISPQPRLITVGACLPYDCTKDDVAHLAISSEDKVGSRTVNIVQVKAIFKEPYDFWSDFMFQLML